VAGCSDRAAELGAKWGCGPVDGLGQIVKGGAPGFILVGEFTETSEAPAAFAELACHLAARQGEKDGPLFVGVSEYLGGATDAETRMRVRLDALVAKGAPIAIGVIGGDDHPYSVRQRSLAEKEWARNIEVKVAAAAASRALLLMSRTDAIADTIPPRGDRFAGYDPMATFLPKNEVLALEIRNTPQAGVSAPAIRLYPKMTDGFHGQIALASLTRPEVDFVIATSKTNTEPLVPAADVRALLSGPGSRESKIKALADILESQGTIRFGADSGWSLEAQEQMFRVKATQLYDIWSIQNPKPEAPATAPTFPVEDEPVPN
jgi:hypothetical protein